MVRMRWLANVAMKSKYWLFIHFIHAETFAGLMEVNERPAVFFGDHAQRTFDGGVAIAPGCAKDIADQAMGVNAHQRRQVWMRADITLDERNMGLIVQLAFIG